MKFWSSKPETQLIFAHLLISLFKWIHVICIIGVLNLYFLRTLISTQSQNSNLMVLFQIDLKPAFNMWAMWATWPCTRFRGVRVLWFAKILWGQKVYVTPTGQNVWRRSLPLPTHFLPQLINFKSYSTVKPFGIGCQKILRLTVFQLIGQFKKAVIHTIELDRYEIDLKQKRSECERWNEIWDRSKSKAIWMWMWMWMWMWTLECELKSI